MSDHVGMFLSICRLGGACAPGPKVQQSEPFPVREAFVKDPESAQSLDRGCEFVFPSCFLPFVFRVPFRVAFERQLSMEADAHPRLQWCMCEITHLR
eukprot:gene17629-biopygen6815